MPRKAAQNVRVQSARFAYGDKQRLSVDLTVVPVHQTDVASEVRLILWRNAKSKSSDHYKHTIQSTKIFFLPRGRITSFTIQPRKYNDTLAFLVNLVTLLVLQFCKHIVTHVGLRLNPAEEKP